MTTGEIDTFDTDVASEPPVRQPRLGFTGWVRFVWRRLTSMSTALLLLMLLAVAAVPGSVFPQRRIDPGRVDAYLQAHATTGPWLDRFGFFDVYSSPWFGAVYVLLFVSLVGCVIPRARQHWRAFRARPPRMPRRLDRLPSYAVGEVPPDADPQALLATAAAALGRSRYRVASDPDGVAAERGYLAEFGNLLFHVALLGVLAAVAIGALYSWQGQVLVVKGQTFSDTTVMFDDFRAGTRVNTDDLPPFSFTLDDLAVVFDDQATGSQYGAPRRFDALVTVQDHPGATPEQVLVRPNKPLDVDGASAYLVGNGYAPVITVKDAKGDVVFSGPVPFRPQDSRYTSLGVVKVPDAAPRQLAFTGFLLPTARLTTAGPVSIFPDALTPRLLLRAYAGRPGKDDIGLDSGVPQSVYVLDTGKLTELTDGKSPWILLEPGGSYPLPDGLGTVTFDSLERFASFDVHNDPSKGWALGAGITGLAGLMLSLFIRRRRVWVRVGTDEQGRNVVEVAGLSRGEDAGLTGEVERLLAQVTTTKE